MLVETSNRKTNVLLVEDNTVDVFINSRVLNHIGVVDGISVAPNGRQALDILNDTTSETQNLPDVILLDLHMPVMDGFAFMKALNEMNLEGKKKILTVVVSCSNWPMDMERVHALGITNYLLKPVSAEDILRVFEENGIQIEQ